MNPRAARDTWSSEIWRYRQLLWSLTWREVRVRYKQSLLGIGWAVLLPLATMLVFAFVFTRAVELRALPGIEAPYALYAFAGLVPWTFFAAGLTGCVNSLVANRNLVTKVYFPREVFPLSCVGSALVDFLIALGVMVLLMLVYHARGDWPMAVTPAVLVVPIVVLVQIIFTVGLGMLLAMGNLFYRDVRPITAVVVQLWMFVSGVVVPLPRDGSLTAQVLSLNPMAPLVQAFRDTLLHGRVPEATGLIYAGAVAIAALVLGWVVFRRAAHRFAECI